MPDPVQADIVNDWFRERLACGALARNTEAYNQVVSALPVLIEQLGGAEPPVAVETAPASAPALEEHGPEDHASEEQPTA